MKCKKCGKENELNSKFCIYCGQKFFDKKIIVIPISIAVVIATPPDGPSFFIAIDGI